MNTSAPPGAPVAPVALEPPYRHPAFGRARSLLSHFKQIDLFMVFMWVLSTVMPFAQLQPLRFIAAAYLAAAFLLFSRQLMPLTFRAWPLFILPVFCFVSSTWAPVSGDAIRKGVLLGLTGLAAIYAAGRISGRNILFIFMVVEGIGAVLSILQPNVIDGNWNGIFGQKNYLSSNMLLLFVCSLGLTFDKGSNRWIRLSAFGMVGVSLLVIIMARSATVMLLTGIAMIGMVGHALLWAPASRVRHMRWLIVAFGATVALVASLLLFGLMDLDAKNVVLQAFGKDSTLTGRTYLWQIAERVMAEHPWTGVGANGFWRPEHGAANSITQYFFYETYTPFSFHNSYLENGVSFGYPGYWATVFLAGWAIWQAAMNWLRNQNSINTAFLVLAITIIFRTTAEIDLSAEFKETAFLLFIGAARKEKSAKQRMAEAIAQTSAAAPNRATS